MEVFLNTLNAFIWGIPVLLMILILGILLTVISRGAQFRMLPDAFVCFWRSMKIKTNETNGISGYRALCTALAATVGTGNLAGVAGAIALGGPGSVFWIWVSGFLGMITKAAEVILSICFREKNSKGEYVGGPMYIIKNGLAPRFHSLSYMYSYFGIVAALGIGNAVQINAVTDGLKNIAYSLDWQYSNAVSLIFGVLITIMIISTFKKGVSCIGMVAEKLVPFAAVIYILLSVSVLIVCADRIPGTLTSIFQGALTPRAVTGGTVGSLLITVRTGISRGVFTNEAGMGTASIAHAASSVKDPVEQGLLGMIEVFLDTIVICTLTAFVILCSETSIPYAVDAGIRLTLDAFSHVLGNWCRILLTVLTCVFAIATMIGWGLYGARCAQYLFGDAAWGKFVWAQAAAVIAGTVLQTSTVWLFAEIVNGLMAMPNLLAIYHFRHKFIAV